MCTVSFVKTNNKVIITSNRDEKVIRPSAIPPAKYDFNGTNLIFPKDMKGGGSWYVVSEKGTAVVLLNGAEEKHQVDSWYRKSRGLIVLEIMIEASPKDFWNHIDLVNIEPFTLVLFQEEQLFQLRWNGKVKEKLQLDANKKHIWSSSTLYSCNIRKQREALFNSFIEDKELLSEQEMYEFHRYTDKENNENGLVINRNEEMKTLSITQAIFESGQVQVMHYDLITDEEFATSIQIC